MLEGGLDAIVGFFEGAELEALSEYGERNLCPPRSQLGRLAEQEEHVAVNIIVEAVVFELFAEKGEELLNDGLFVFAKPRAIVDVVIGLWALRELFFEDFEEGGLAEAIGLVDIDDEGALAGLGGIEGGEDFLDEEESGGVVTVFIVGGWLVGIEGDG